MTLGNRVAGKVAIVTGAAAGIGQACAQRLAAEGARVAVTDIDAEGGAACVDKIRAAGGDAIFLPHDAASENDWARVVAETVAAFGGLHVLVNNAGFAFAAGIEETTTEQWRGIMSVNVDGVFLGTKLAIPEMRKSGGGSIINMSSVLGITGDAVMAAYCATKGAVRLFTKAVALESAEGGWGIRVNSVHPAFIRTPMVDRYAETFETTDAGYAELGRRQPMGRVGEAVEVANAVLYLASEEASFVTGTELIVDGGYTAR